MVLDSQIRRGGGGRRRTSGARRRGRRWPIVFAAIVCVAGAAWLMWPTSPPEAGAGATPERERTDTVASANDGETDEAGGAPTRSADRADDSQATASTASSRSNESDATASDRTGSQRASGRQRDDASESITPPTVTLDRPRSSDDASSARRDREADAQGPAQQPPRPDAGSSSSPSSDTGDPVARARDAARGASGDLQHGMDLIADRDFVEGRRVLSRLLYSGQLSSRDARTVRDTLISVNRELIFSSAVDPDDPLVTTYRVQPGDHLASIARQYHVPYGFVMEVNSISDARRIQVGQTLKLVKGPLHARVFKRDYIMDITVDGPEGEPIFVHSFPVGLGEHDSTPPGEWKVATNSKVVNPNWRNPRTGEFYHADDPDNPLGGYWLGLRGTDDDTRDLRGYGIHGTIEPDTVGQQASMGCIRLRDGDIERVFHMLQEGHSRVTVLP